MLILDDLLAIYAQSGVDPGGMTRVTSHLPFLESKVKSSFIDFLSFIFWKKSCTALVINFTFPKLLPQNCHPPSNNIESTPATFMYHSFIAIK